MMSLDIVIHTNDEWIATLNVTRREHHDNSALVRYEYRYTGSLGESTGSVYHRPADGATTLAALALGEAIPQPRKAEMNLGPIFWTRRNRRVTLRWIFAILIMFGLAVAQGFPNAHADVPLTPDQQTYADTYGADAICIVIAAYPNPDGVVGVAMGVMKDGYTPDDAVDIINYAVQTYCPNFWPLLQRTGQLYQHKQQLLNRAA